VCNATVGLEAALRAVGAQGDIIVPDYTYPATCDVVLLQKRAASIIADISPDTMLIDYEEIEPESIVMPVSLFGNPLDYDEIHKREPYCIIEDAACALGSRWRGTYTGKLADITVFSFHPRKTLTTGEGGMIVTDNDFYAEMIGEYIHFGLKGERFNSIGTNYKMSDIQAALGVVQMRHINELVSKKIELAQRYINYLENYVSIPKITAGGKHSYQSFCVFVKDNRSTVERLAKRGIQSRIGTYALHKERAFNNNPFCYFPDDLSGSDYADKHCLALPLYYDMTYEEQDTVIEALKKEEEHGRDF